MRNRKKSHRLIFYKEEQCSAPVEMTEIKRAHKLLDRGFSTNILGNVLQKVRYKYMQGAHKIDARYLGVVVW